MEHKIPPLPPKRPIISKSTTENISSKNINAEDIKEVNLKNTTIKSDIGVEKVETQGQGEVKKKFELNSQTKAFILFFAAFFCFAGAIAFFVLLFI